MPVYNPVFINQIYNLVRSRCVYCSHLKLEPIRLHKAHCQLLLLRYGLLDEAAQLDTTPLNPEKELLQRRAAGLPDDEISKLPDDVLTYTEEQSERVREAFKAHGGQKYLKAQTQVHSQPVSEFRRNVIKKLFAASRTAAKCGHCDGYVKA